MRGSGIIQPCLTSFFRTSLSSELYFKADLWFPRSINSLFFAGLSFLLIGNNGQFEPSSRIFRNFGQFGWWHNKGCKISGFLNSDPKDMNVPFWVSRNL